MTLKEFSGRFKLIVGEDSDAVQMTLDYGGKRFSFLLAPNQWVDFVDAVNAANKEMTEESFTGHA